MKLSRAIVKLRVPIVILTLILMVPSLLGMLNTRVNYDMLTYLPDSMDTGKGQKILLDEFDKGAFSFIILEDMPDKDVADLKAKVEQVDQVASVLWYNNIADISIPKEFLPDKVYNAFNTDHSTVMAVFFNTSTSSDETMDAIREIRSITGEKCFVCGLSALVTDLKDLCEKEEPIYVGIAVILALVAMILLLDNWLVPLVFIASIGMMILMNLGSNFFLGEISYITKALSAVLQLAVTMDYSIFLWHSYNEQKQLCADNKEAMAVAIHHTFLSVIGSSITTVAGFIALCFMTFTLGRDLGIVMAKGVLFGVLGCITVLPSLILILDKPLMKMSHRSLIPNMRKLSGGVVKIFPLFLVIFIALVPPFLYGYTQTNNEVYYDMAECLPEDLDFVIANTKLSEDFDISSTHMVLMDASLDNKSVKQMISEMEKVDGVKYVLGIESLLGSTIPEDILPEHIKGVLENDKYELLLINSKYHSASDAVGEQINSLNEILHRYDKNGMLIGEAPCMKDMIDTTGRDFEVVNLVSVIAIFIIIALVERSITLPFILISVIELAIFINLGLPHYFGQSLPFIAPICISTIQLGATVDYAILMTTRYKSERLLGNDKKEAMRTTLTASIPSILVSGMGLFAATFGVAIYSDIDIISSMCMLLARGAVISMLLVIFILPALLLLCDKPVCYTTWGMKKCIKKDKSI